MWTRSRQSPKRLNLEVSTMIKLAKCNYIKTKLVESRYDTRVTWPLVSELRDGHSVKRSVDETVEKYFLCSLFSAANVYNAHFGNTSSILRDNDVDSSLSNTANVLTAFFSEIRASATNNTAYF